MKFNVYSLISLAVYLFLIAYAARIIKFDMVPELYKSPVFRIIVIVVILASAMMDANISMLLLIIYALETSKLSIEQFAPYSKEYEATNPQRLVEPTNQIYPGCLGITAQALIDEFAGDKKALQDTVLHGYKQLLKSIPETSSSRETLDAMAKAVGLPFSVELSDETAPLVATMLIVQGFKLSDSCRPPKEDIQNTPMQLLDGSVVSPIDQGDYFKL